MKTLLLIFLSVLFFSARAQVKDSVVCLPVKQVQQSIKVNEKYKFLLRVDSAQTAYIQTLLAGMQNRDQTVSNLNAINQTQGRTIDSDNEIISNDNTKYNLEASYASDLQKALTKQKIITFAVGGIGIAVTTTLFILLIKK